MAYFAILALSAVASWGLTFAARWLAVRCGAVAPVTDRSVHDQPLPTAGGVSMFLAFLLAFGVASRIPHFREVFHSSTEPLGVVLAATAILAVGLLDDLRDVSAPAKVAGQVFAGSVLYLFGVTMLYFQVPFAGFVSLSADLEPLITVGWVLVITNAVNLIDGLDGLAAGIIAIAAGAFFLYSIKLSHAGLLPTESVGPLLAVICCGICVGFLPHNVHKAKIMMGDAGALFLGLLMAASTMAVGGHTADTFSGQKFFFFAPVFIPFVVLGVPMSDTAFAIVRRTVKRARGEGTKLMEAGDKEHLHHRLMDMGHGHRRAVIILWAWTAILSALVLYPIYFNRGNEVIPIGIAALAVLLFTVLHPRLRPPVDLPGLDTPLPGGSSPAGLPRGGLAAPAVPGAAAPPPSGAPATPPSGTAALPAAGTGAPVGPGAASGGDPATTAGAPGSSTR